MSIEQVIPPVIDDSANGGLVALARDCSAFSKASQLRVLVTADAEGTTAANTRRFTMQVANRKRSACRGLYLLMTVWGTTEAGGPGGGQTVSVVTGSLAASLVANQTLVVMTDANGKAVVDVSIAGAATLYPRVAVVPVNVDGGFSWT